MPHRATRLRLRDLQPEALHQQIPPIVDYHAQADIVAA